MKRNFKTIILGIIILLLMPVFGFSQKKCDEKDLLVGILEEMGAEFLEGEINFGGDILDRFIGYEEIINIGDAIKSELCIDGNSYGAECHNIQLTKDYCREEIIEEDGFIQLMIQGIDPHNNIITITLSSYMDAIGDSGKVSLFINLLNREKFVEINDIIIKAGKIFDSYQRPVNITTCVIGTVDGRMDAREKQKIVQGVTKTIKGSIIEEYREEGILSSSIYTPYIEEYIFTGNKKMNLNIAIRFNEYEGLNYIWIGTPIITVGY